mgnify:CR=1 FL=1
MDILKVENLTKIYGKGENSFKALDNVSFSVKRGQFVAIVGPSGSGKSTLLHLIGGVDRPDGGHVYVDGNDVYARNDTQLAIFRRREVGLIYQFYNLIPVLNVVENVTLPVLMDGRKVDEERLEELLTVLHLKGRENHLPNQLSGGQQQRVALARILASDPEVLMLDEPFSALDAFLKEKLQLELLELLSGYDKDILMVTHSRDEIYRFCEHMLIVEDGRQAGFGVTKEIFKNPGTPAAAKLTGCKNIEKIERVDDHTMVLPNWNTTVCVKGMIPENTTHIGIRAHYLRLPENGQRENLVECQNGKILNDPFELVVVFEHDVWWKIPKESWQKEYQEKMPQYLAIPEESILSLHG